MIKVIDSIMGSGKTSWAIQEINRHSDTPFIFCTPFLDEIRRIKKATDRHFADPQYIDGRKLNGFNKLLMDGADIAVTHATFANSDDDTLSYLQQGNYVLILDEVLDVLIRFNDISSNKVNRDDIKLLVNEGFIDYNQYGQVRWIKDSYPDSMYSDVEQFAKNGNLFYLDETLLVWQFPPQIFQAFREVYVLTYMFEGSFLKPYFEYHRLDYERVSIANDGNGNYSIVPYVHDTESQKRYANLISICDNARLNNYKATSLSMTWFREAKKRDIDRIKNDLFNYFHNIAKAKANDILWTCPKEYRKSIKGKGFNIVRRLTEQENNLPTDKRERLVKKLQCFLSSNARATNDYKDRCVLAYIYNSYPNPYVKRYFENKNKTDGTNIGVDLEAFALANMLQWIWRSRIRENQPIKIYIPSVRMQRLLCGWLAGTR